MQNVLARSVLMVLMAAVALPSVSLGQQAATGLRVLLVMADGSQAPFVVGGAEPEYRVYYQDGANSPGNGYFHVDYAGARIQLPVTEVIRADLVEPGKSTTWSFMLRDGRILQGSISTSYGSGAAFRLEGTNEFGTAATLSSHPRRADAQPFVAVIFDPAAVAAGEMSQATLRADADNVNLRNGDILSGTILTGEFTIQASYGSLTFTKEDLQSITVENIAGRTDQALLKVGDRVSGVLQNSTIEMALTSGATITLEKGNIASITFATEQ